MSTKLECRLFIDAPGSGAWNMALDEVLLESAAHGVASLRFYRWSEPTLSLGYFQKYANREQHADSKQSSITRRASGGGAIVHDQELTYSIALPVADSIAADPAELYDAAHASLVEALAAWGVRATRFAVDVPQHCDPKAMPFLCFQGRAAGDVLVDRFKVCGSAQRRRQGAILQHGSVLLAASAAASELPGLRELAGVTLHENELVAAWQGRLATRLGVRLFAADYTAEELSAARHLTISKYSADEWIRRR